MTSLDGTATFDRLRLAAAWRARVELNCRRLAVFGATLTVLAADGAGAARAQTVGQVFRQVKAAVVTIRTTERDPAPTGQASVPGVGSGVLVSRDGKVVTAAHVVQTADEIAVHFDGGETVRATVIASEPQADVALLQLERVPPGTPAATLGDSDAVEVGDQVIVVGAPYGISHTLTVGHISARHRPNTVYSALALAEFFQSDAAINQGNSGGPMFSMRGEVVGIVSHIISKSGGFEGLGFVVTANMARRLLLERRSFWSGLSGKMLTGDVARALNLPQEAGVLIERVAARSPAALLGLRGGTMAATIDGDSYLLGGDILLDVFGFSIGDLASYQKIQERLAAMKSGDEVTLRVLRDGRVVDLKAALP